MGAINMTIVLISLPTIFRGLNIDPTAPEGHKQGRKNDAIPHHHPEQHYELSGCGRIYIQTPEK